MKEYPILFQGEMIRQILSGNKTQTRRSMKVQPLSQPGGRWEFIVHSTAKSNEGKWLYSWPDTAGDRVTERGRERCTGPIQCPYGQPGDRLWVKEAWAGWLAGDFPNIDYRAGGGEPNGLNPPGEGYDAAHACWHDWKWRSGIFMPRWASRILLEIVSVRVERLQDISAHDAVAEGIEKSIVFDEAYPADRNKALVFHKNYLTGYWGAFSDLSVPNPEEPEPRAAVASYRSLWASINGPGSWEANPWLWCISFQRLPPPTT